MSPCRSTLPQEALPTLVGSFGSVLCGVPASFLWVLVHARFCLYPPRMESQFPPILWHLLVIKSCWSSRSGSLGIPSPLVGFPGWETWHGVQNIHSGGRTWLLLFSPACESPTWQVWDLIVSGCCSSNLLPMVLLFLWTCSIFFLGVGSNVLLSIALQQLAVFLVLLQEEISGRPSTLQS